MKKQRFNSIFFVSLLFLIGLWFLVSNHGLIDTLFLPTPEQMKEALTDLFGQRDFVSDIGVSTFRVFAAFLLSLAMAIPLALLMSESKTLNKLLEPYIDFIRYLPVPALIPVTILFFGLGEISKIALLFIGTFFQMILLIIDDIRHIPKDYFDLSRTLGFSRMKIFTMKLRAVGPQLYDNARITLGFAWTYLVIAELVAAQAGVGYVIKEAQRFSDTPRVYIAILSLGVLGLFTDQLFKLFYPYFFPYKKYD